MGHGIEKLGFVTLAADKVTRGSGDKGTERLRNKETK
jgi:hypothetical protein